MYNTATTANATAPTAAAAWLASLCRRPRIAAPYMGRRCAPARSLRAACIAAGYSVALTQAVLATANRRALAGKPIYWPS